MDEVVGIGTIDSGLDLLRHAARDRVEPLRPVQRDGRDAILACVGEMFIVHRGLPKPSLPGIVDQLEARGNDGRSPAG